MSVDLDALNRRWQQSWPQCPPIGHLFRRHMPDRWVRFHSLPFGQRYPTNAADYTTLLQRYNAILGELAPTEIYLITVEYPAHDLAAGTEPTHVGLHPDAVNWMRAVDPDDPGASYDLRVSRQHFTAGGLDPLLRYIADDQAREVVITDTSLSWLYHPYDGGMDVILPSATQRDHFKARFTNWLSTRPDGL